MPDDVSRFIINLPDRLDRRLEMEQQLDRVGWRDISSFQRAEKPDSAADFPSIGARGCFLSHLATLGRARISGNHVLIMEDDLDFTPDFNRLWYEACEELSRRDWSIFYPAHTLKDGVEGLHQVASDRGVICAHFVMFHRNAVPGIIGGLKTILSRPAGHPLGGPMHVDGAYSTIRAQNPGLKTYAMYPSLGYQRPSKSDIAGSRFYDRIELLSPVMKRLRAIKRAVRSSHSRSS